MTVIWTSPLRGCDLCGTDFDGLMYDASVRGRWGNFCHDCFTACGCSLGTGHGQKYELQSLSDGRKAWVKVEG